jgi:nucleotide-binding universal stress UspA family protein
MDQSLLLHAPFVHSIFHPSDFSVASENAFAHALALALMCQTTFTILHAGGSLEDWERFPAVRTTLERWGLLEKGSPHSAVFEQLAVRVTKVNLQNRSPLRATLDYLTRYPTDLIVMATEGRQGLPRFLQPSVAERIAERSGTQTLFVPAKARGFVSLQTGQMSLHRILLPVDHHPSPLPAIEYASRIVTAIGEPVEVHLLHVGETAPMPAYELPEIPHCLWHTEHRRGEVVNEVIKAAHEYDVELIMMATAGHEGILDALRGSVTQQVLRRAPCPLLAVPSL